MKDVLVNQIENTITECIQTMLSDRRVIGILSISAGIYLCITDNKKEGK